MSDPKPSRPAYVSVVIALVGVVLSLIALYHHTAVNNQLDVGPSSFCSISATMNCDAVNKSAWSYLFGIPVASYGIFFYGLVILFSFAGGASALLSLSTIALLFSLILFLISETIIGVLCPVCLSMYAVNLVLFLANYFPGRSVPLVSRIGASISSLLKITFRSAYSGAVIFTIILLAYAAYTAADIMLVRVVLPVAMERRNLQTPRDPKKIAAKALADWQSAPAIILPSSSDASSATQDYEKGPSNAPIQLVEFSDFECPYCRKFSFEIDSLLHDYDGKLRFTFRNFPLDQSCNPTIPREMHQNACNAAEFARCAGEQGKFWNATSFLFSMPEFDNESPKATVTAAIDAGIDKLSLDRSAIEECKTSGRTKEKLLQDINTAMDLGIEGTPFIIVNNKIVKGPSPVAMRAIFDSILKQ